METQNNVAASESTMEGHASVIKAQPVVVTAVVQVTRAGTGKVDEYTLTGTVEPEQLKEPK